MEEKNIGLKIMEIKKEVEKNFCPKFNKESNCPKCPIHCLTMKLGDIYFSWLTGEEKEK